MNVLLPDCLVHFRYAVEIVKSEHQRDEGQHKHSDDVEAKHGLRLKGVNLPAVPLLKVESHLYQVAVCEVEILLDSPVETGVLEIHESIVVHLDIVGQ